MFNIFLPVKCLLKFQQLVALVDGNRISAGKNLVDTEHIVSMTMLKDLICQIWQCMKNKA